MFEGTSKVFKFSYYITAMTPAYILFILQLNFNSDRWINYGLCVVIFVLEYWLGGFINRLLFQRNETGVSNGSYEMEIDNRNGEVITFLFGVIIPSVLLPDNSGNVEKVIILFLIQWVSYIVFTRGSDIIPNIILLLRGIDIYKNSNGQYVMTLQKKLKKNQKLIQVHRLGDSIDNNVFILDKEN